MRRSRREFLQGALAFGGLSSLPACWAPLPQAQPPPGMRRIGILDNFPSQQWDAFRMGLSELGYVEGQGISLEERWSDGIRDRFPGLAAELVALKVDVVVASGNPAARAAEDPSTAS